MPQKVICILSTIVLYLIVPVSLLTAKPDKEITDEFEAVKAFKASKT